MTREYSYVLCSRNNSEHFICTLHRSKMPTSFESEVSSASQKPTLLAQKRTVRLKSERK